MYDIGHHETMKNSLIKPLLTLSFGLGLFTATVSCAVLASSKPFTVQGELPANTGITFLATYYPEDDQSSACSYRDLASGGSEIRGGTVGTEVPLKAEAQNYQVSIPTQNYDRRCKVILTGVSVEVANADNNDHQTDKAGFIGIVDKTPLPVTQEHPAQFNMSCEWSFSVSPIKSRPNDDIRKFMRCTFDKNQYVSRNMALSDLTNQSMVLNVTFNKEEKPAVETSWKKVEGGWKPCKGGFDYTGFCKTPPEFIKFKYQGKNCSVYPTCTE